MRLALAWIDYSLRTIKARSKKVSDMQHLIVVAHPAEDSFTMGLTRSYSAELEKLGHSQRTCDLYRMGPCSDRAGACAGQFRSSGPRRRGEGAR
jgi:hypothetical protein